LKRDPRVHRSATLWVAIAFAIALVAGTLVVAVPPVVAASCNGASHQTTL